LEKALRQSLMRIAQLEQKVNELAARLNRHSGNSSQPPSQDPPHAPKNQREKSVRHPGGQPGHQGDHLQLAPPEKVDKVVEHRAEACPHGWGLLTESAERQLPPMERHQVGELPEIRPVVTNHRLGPVGVPLAGYGLKPGGPAGVERSAFARLQAWVAILTGRFRQSRRPGSELLQDLGGVRVIPVSIRSL
jgi:transposase